MVQQSYLLSSERAFYLDTQTVRDRVLVGVCAGNVLESNGGIRRSASNTAPRVWALVAADGGARASFDLAGPNMLSPQLRKRSFPGDVRLRRKEIGKRTPTIRRNWAELAPP